MDTRTPDNRISLQQLQTLRTLAIYQGKWKEHWLKKNSTPCEWKILRNPRQSIIKSNHGNMTFSLANSVKQVQERQTKHDGEAASPSPKSNRLNMWSRAGVSCSYVLYVYTVLTVPVDIRSSTVSPSPAPSPRSEPTPSSSLRPQVPARRKHFRRAL